MKINERIGIRVDGDEARRWREQADRLGRTVSDLVREAMRRESAPDVDDLAVQVLEAALAAAHRRLHKAPVCAGCGTPRFPDHPDPMFDALAHAQCDQNMAALERNAA